MRRHRRAKIVATVGPASSSPEMLKELFLAGVDTFRLNFSHGTQDGHAKVHAAIALEIADRAYVMDRGSIVHEGAAAELLADEMKRKRLLGI